MNYSVVFDIERDIDYSAASLWMKENWHVTFFYGAAYVICVFIGRHLMHARPGFELRRPLLVWNASLAVFSLMGALRTVPALLWVINTYGFKYSICDDWFTRGVTGYWTFLFNVSKCPELVDTLFIILRKRRLVFLHWYHHVTVLVYSWYSYSESTGAGLWFMSLNYSVHAAMYAYYALRSADVRLPRWVSVALTSCQLAQMVVGMAVSYVAWQLKSAGEACAGSAVSLKFGLLMYVSYAVLFAHFFWGAYIQPQKPPMSLTEVDASERRMRKNQ
ncbi:PREDICTED: elongation of very long chain fatty acids protein 6-like [Priapulus caudatus]|uniref:Elongation of very long chain fatty acids protein n=1 Tax=Priapulus caudatus TaxID=37621 RepID=A0ABM1F5H7_PRICU|nr:PREDICTED: elongation of very long chain fatty acids protein 6-like [Priapulus caudatus]